VEKILYIIYLIIGAISIIADYNSNIWERSKKESWGIVAINVFFWPIYLLYKIFLRIY
jgi:hypothetical protein